MSKQVTFDYSKTSPFISNEEVGYMKKLTLDAKAESSKLSLETTSAKELRVRSFTQWVSITE